MTSQSPYRDGEIGQILIYLDNQVVHYERRVYNLYDLIGDIGGIYQIVISVFVFALNQYTEKLFNFYSVNRFFGNKGDSKIKPLDSLQGQNQAFQGDEISNRIVKQSTHYPVTNYAEFDKRCAKLQRPDLKLNRRFEKDEIKQEENKVEANLPQLEFYRGLIQKIVNQTTKSNDKSNFQNRYQMNLLLFSYVDF